VLNPSAKSRLFQNLVGLVEYKFDHWKRNVEKVKERVKTQL